MSVSTATDLGHFTRALRDRLAGSSLVLLESNHDPELLARSRYPDFLKQRISGLLGHLNNTQAAQILQDVTHSGLGIVVAAHLSERNNDPQQVRSGFADALGRSADDVFVSDRNGLDWLPV